MNLRHHHSFPLLMAFAWGFATCVQSAIVGPAGYTNDFSTRPAAADFATSATVIGGVAGDITTAAGMDAYIQNVAASSITAQLTDSSPTNPPAKLAAAQWTSGGGGYVLTRPTGNAATVILAKLANNTGTNCNQLHLNYQFTVGASYAESVQGQRVYYSFATGSNAWTTLPFISGLNSSQLVNTNVLLKQPWTNGTALYLPWADDNSSDSTESAYEIDNLFASAQYVEVPLTISLTAPANGDHFAFGQALAATVVLTGNPTNVSYFVDGQLVAERSAAPFTPVTLPDQPLGPHTIYATARDAGNNRASTDTNTFVIDD